MAWVAGLGATVPVASISVYPPSSVVSSSSVNLPGFELDTRKIRVITYFIKIREKYAY